MTQEEKGSLLQVLFGSLPEGGEPGDWPRLGLRARLPRFWGSWACALGRGGHWDDKSRSGEGPGSPKYLSRLRLDSAPGAAARSSDKSPRPAREGAAGPGTEKPGPRAPPGTEALRPPKPRSYPRHSSLWSSGSNPSRGRTGAGQGGPKNTLLAAAPRGSALLLITSPQGPRPSRGIPRQLASLAPHGRPLHIQGLA